MSTIHCFKPIANTQAKTLILGSMPGRASLAVDQYYAHPQNAFWRIMAALFSFDPHAPYTTRTQALLDVHIAVWDVLQSCTRTGSLDAMIDRDAQVANDFSTFFRTHPHITRVFFNGGTAETCFKCHVLQAPSSTDFPALDYLRLPSTSPAHASLSFDQKLSAWRVVAPPSDILS